MNRVVIYALIEPSGSVKYVGRTKQRLATRLNQHIDGARRGKFRHPRAQWIRRLLASGQRPLITHLETVAEQHQVEAEARWIKRYTGLVNSGTSSQGGTRSYVVRWTPELDARLGKDSDGVLAEELGVNKKTVLYRRRVLGIPASFNRARNSPPPPMAGHNKITLPQWVVELLGAMPDYKLAMKAEVSKRTIIRARHSAGIPSYASATGQTGQFKTGSFPLRWLKESR